MPARLVPLCIALLVIAMYGVAAPASAVPHTQVLEALASWLPIGDSALRARIAFGVVAGLAAWAVTRAMALGQGPGGAIAGGFAACLLVGSPAWMGAGLGPAVATGAALIALAATRRLVTSSAPHDAVAAALAVLVAASFEPGYAAMALPLFPLWWLRVGRRAALSRNARSPVGQLHLASALVAPALALGALGVAILRGASAPLLWPGWKLGGAPLASSGVAGALRAVVEMMGPTATVAAVAGGVALLLPAKPPGRKLTPEAVVSMSDGAVYGAMGGGNSGAASGAGAAPGNSAPNAGSAAHAAHASFGGGDAGRGGGWILLLLVAMAAGGVLCDVRRHAIGVPVMAAIALAAGFAIQRLAAMAIISVPAAQPAMLAGGDSARMMVPAGGGHSGRVAAVAVDAAPPMVTIAAGAIFVALTTGFLVLAPSLLAS